MTLILSRSDVAGLVRSGAVAPADVIAAVEAVLAEHRRTASNAAARAVPGPGDALFLPMIGVSAAFGLAGGKVLSDIPANRGRGLSVQRSVLTLVSAVDGGAAAVIDGALPTRMRTAAATTVATRHLARPDARVLGLVGAGPLAVEHACYLATDRPLDKVLVWSRSDRTVAAFEEQLARRAPGVSVHLCRTAREVVESAEIVCTLTPAREPVVRGAWLRPGQHVNVVGAPPRPDHREVDSEALARSHVVVDDLETVRHESGDLLLAVADGDVSLDDCTTELGAVLRGEAPGRSAAGEITLFDSVGIAILDLAVGRVLIDAARARNVGLERDLGA